jgi:methylated-DNA-[protein]-cysteine S-methyltransferase
MKNTISFNSKFGWITATEENNKIIEINFFKKKNLGNSPTLKKLKRSIIRFFSKKTKTIDTPFKLEGNLFQKRIWNELKKIKYGETKSYGDIAKKLKTSPRYIGKVCGQNKHILVIPCHRVVRSDGGLGGFSSTGGIKLKQKLLNFEQT